MTRWRDKYLTIDLDEMGRRSVVHSLNNAMLFDKVSVYRGGDAGLLPIGVTRRMMHLCTRDCYFGNMIEHIYGRRCSIYEPIYPQH